MAINIREILHPSDSDSIKFEKINYNFDQILANGGGPRGLKGQKGDQGNPGLTGTKGDQGIKGDQGLKGETGTTNTPWSSVDPSNDTTYKILKPKRLGLTYTPVVFIGDETFDETLTQDGTNTGINSKLTIKKDSIAFDNYITLLDDISGEKIVFTGSYDTGQSITRFAIQNAFQASNIQFAISVDYIDLDSNNNTNITGGSGVNIQSGGDSNIKLETLGNGILDVDSNAEFKGYVKLNNTSDPIAPSAGMIRYNSNTNTFEGYFASNEWKELCTECGAGVSNSVIIGGGNIDANADGTPVNSNSISIGGGNTPSGNIDANADGTPVGGSSTPTPPPSSSAIPPTPTPSSSASADDIFVTFNNTSLAQYTLDDDNGGKGGGPGSASLTYSYNYSGQTSGNDVPTVVQADSRISVTFTHGTYAGLRTYGNIHIDSIDTGGCPANGLQLDDLIIAHPTNSNATYTLIGGLMQAFTCIDFNVYKGSSAQAACGEIGNGSSVYSSADAVWQNGTILYVGANGSSTQAEEGKYYIDHSNGEDVWFNRVGGLGLEMTTNKCSDYSTSS